MKKLKYVSLLLLSLTLTACESIKASFTEDAFPLEILTPKYQQAVVSVEVVDYISESPEALAIAISRGQFCTVKIRKDVYPNCITHEIRHCMEGNWHEGRETDEHCYVKN